MNRVWIKVVGREGCGQAITVRSFWAVGGPTVGLKGPPFFSLGPIGKKLLNGARVVNLGPTGMQQLREKQRWRVF